MATRIVPVGAMRRRLKRPISARAIGQRGVQPPPGMKRIERPSNAQKRAGNARKVSSVGY